MSKLTCFFSVLLFSSPLFASEILDKAPRLALGSEAGFALPSDQTSKEGESSSEKISTKKQVTGDQPDQTTKSKEKENGGETSKQVSKEPVAAPSNEGGGTRNPQSREKTKDDFIRGY